MTIIDQENTVKGKNKTFKYQAKDKKYEGYEVIMNKMT